jgi:hypothetical protein
MEFIPGKYLEPGCSPGRLQVTILDCFEPFTLSCVLKAKVEFPEDATELSRDHDLPPVMVLKLYDRRFANELRRKYKIPPVTFSREDNYRKFAAMGGLPTTEAEWTERYEDEDEDDEDDPPHEVTELRVELALKEGFRSETRAYDAMRSLQGKGIPVVFGQVHLLSDPQIQYPGNIDVSVPGLLIEYIDGTGVDKLDNALFVNTIGDSAIATVNAFGDAGILNRDVKMWNIIVPNNREIALRRPAVVIDFAQCNFRGEEDREDDWMLKKCAQDEEGAVGTVMQKKFGYPYVRSYKYDTLTENGWALRPLGYGEHSLSAAEQEPSTPVA